MLIATTEDLIKMINSLIYRFIWKVNDEINSAGLQSMILAQRVMETYRFSRAYKKKPPDYNNINHKWLRNSKDQL